MKEDPFVSLLLRKCREHGIAFSEEQAHRVFQHVELMLEWNRRVNLTRITEPEQILNEHILDSLIPAQWLPREGSILDVGSGPGFPGVPLKIFSSHRTVVLLESNRKKVSFLRVLLARLGMKSIAAVQGRWEEWERLAVPGIPRKYELIALRSVRLDPRRFGDYARDSLGPGGVLAYWGGELAFPPESLHESTPSPGSLRFRGKHPYTVPGLHKPRYLWLWEKGL
ncbi:MAG TPA: 16S rRNA (guanine(527)-N(7))-methyltransferase RsmG [Syntrophobacteraceae bacterium]|nr:16S rRNA (guanine(527)-N(7))-methyltransferase RsmG [Syntrophobacteraceae bacterium]